MLPDGTGIAFSRIGMSFRVSVALCAHRLHTSGICCTVLRTGNLFHRSATSSMQTMDAFMHHFGAPSVPLRRATSEQHFGEPLHAPLHASLRSATSERPLCQFEVPLRSALCATCHSAVLPARGYPSLFGSQCRLVANCQQRADAVRDITFGVEVCVEEVADCAWGPSSLDYICPDAFVQIIGHG